MSHPALFVVSLLLGLLAGALHAGMLRRAVERAVEDRSAVRLLLFAPVRVFVPVATVLALAPLGPFAVAGALLGVVAASQAARWLAVRETARQEDAS